MPFPETPRVRYRRNPLIEVVCQLRFPRILRIDSAPPVDLQERLRARYPQYVEHTDVVSPGLPTELAAALSQRGLLPSGGAPRKRYVLSNDNNTFTLAADFLALSTRHYERWEDFRAELLACAAIVQEIYEPAWYDRVGLRYKDFVVRSRLGFDTNERWSTLLAPHLLGEMSNPDVEAATQEALRQLVVALDDQGGVANVQHGLVRNDVGEVCYLIDADFYVEARHSPDEAMRFLDRARMASGNLFRWAIGPRLRDALDPVPVQEAT